MSFTVRHEPLTDDDRALVETQAREFETFGASPLVPLAVGLAGALCTAAGFRLVGASTAAAAVMLIGGFVFAAGGLLLAAGRKRFAQVMGAMASRLRRNMGDADHVVVYEVEADAAQLVGGESSEDGDEWSGAVVRTRDGGLVFIGAEVVLQLPRDDEAGVRVPRRLAVRALPTHEVISMDVEREAADETIEFSTEEGARLAAWVRAASEDAPPCREIPAGVLA